MNVGVFHGLSPALMTPFDVDGRPDHDALVESGRRLVGLGMRAVVYCGSMGDWPLLSDADRMAGVEALVAAGLDVVVGTGAQSPARATALAEHAQRVGAAGLMAIPRVLSRGTSPAAQRAHFQRLLDAAPELPTIIYNSPYYGFETRAELFFELRAAHRNLVGFKEFGGADALTYAAEHIAGAEPDIALVVGVDTQLGHGMIRCGAVGAITGVGDVLPVETLTLFDLCRRAAAGDPDAEREAWALEAAMAPLAAFDEGPDLVLFYRLLAGLAGHAELERTADPSDALSPAQRAFAVARWTQFRAWWSTRYGDGRGGGA